MNNKGNGIFLKIIIIFSIIIFVFLGSCSRQNSIYYNKIVGTWVAENETLYVFKSNGTLIITVKNSYTIKYKFSVIDTKLILGNGNHTATYNLSLSSDEKTLILTFAPFENSEGIFLAKK